MSVSNVKEDWSDDYVALMMDVTAVNDFVDMTFPTPIRDYTIQRSLGSGVTSATAVVRVTQSFDQVPSVSAGTASTDTPVSSSAHCLRRARIICTALGGTGTVSIAFVARRMA